jgi:hypothetical protein
MGGSGMGGNSGVGHYTSGITAGMLPSSQVSQASGAMMKPVPTNMIPGGSASSALANHLQDYTMGQQANNNVNMIRAAADTQAKMNAARQASQANSGLGWNNFLANTNETNQHFKNAIAQPILGSVLSGLM